jgi:hypothetical protein
LPPPPGPDPLPPGTPPARTLPPIPVTPPTAAEPPAEVPAPEVPPPPNPPDARGPCAAHSVMLDVRTGLPTLAREENAHREREEWHEPVRQGADGRLHLELLGVEKLGAEPAVADLIRRLRLASPKVAPALRAAFASLPRSIPFEAGRERPKLDIFSTRN